MMLKTVRIRSFEVGLKFRDGEFAGLVEPGKRWVVAPMGNVAVQVVSKRAPWLVHEQLDVMIQSGKLENRVEVVDLKDGQRALAWVDGRFAGILSPGLHAYWLGARDVRVEVVDVDDPQFQHAELKTILRSTGAAQTLDVCAVHRDHVGVLFIDGQFVEVLKPGLYAFWKDAADSRVVEMDVRELQIDVSGQEIITADKVTLRMNVIVTYCITDPQRALSASDDPRQALYREAQLALRSVVGGRDLDSFLTAKLELTSELQDNLRERAETLGLELRSVGIRDVILPGEMKQLMNRVIEAKKAAEANLISRREETAAMRSQANTAKLLADNPTLMRLRELEILEQIAASGSLNVILGEKGLADRVTNLL